MGDGAEGIAVGIIYVGLIMTWDFVVYLIPSCISAFVFYFTKSSSLKKSFLSLLSSLLVFVVSIHILELLYPMDKKIFYYGFLKLFSISTAIIFNAMIAAISHLTRDKK